MTNLTQIRADVYAELFDIFRLPYSEAESVNDRAKRTTEHVIKHCQVENLMALLKASRDASAILSKRNIDAAILITRLSGHEIGIHRVGDKEPYYTTWNDGEYWIKQALSTLMGEL